MSGSPSERRLRALGLRATAIGKALDIAMEP